MVHLSDHRNRNRIIKNSRQGPWQIILPGLRLFFASEDGKGQQMPRFPVWNDVLEMFHPVCKEWKLLTDARDLIKADRGCLQAGLQTTTICLDEVSRVREQLPLLAHRMEHL